MTLATDTRSIRADVQSAGNLLTGFYAPWDEHDTRPLWLLKEALDAQQRALEALRSLVERGMEL